jgi:hypothetical protein
MKVYLLCERDPEGSYVVVLVSTNKEKMGRIADARNTGMLFGNHFVIEKELEE